MCKPPNPSPRRLPVHVPGLRKRGGERGTWPCQVPAHRDGKARVFLAGSAGKTAPGRDPGLALPNRAARNTLGVRPVPRALRPVSVCYPGLHTPTSSRQMGFGFGRTMVAVNVPSTSSLQARSPRVYLYFIYLLLFMRKAPALARSRWIIL